MQVDKFKATQGWGSSGAGQKLVKPFLFMLGLLALLMTSMASFAEDVSYQACDDPQSKEKVRIYFSNGMENSFVDAVDSLLETKRAIGYNTALGITPLSYGLSYNLNEDGLAQLAQVFWQKNIELGGSFTEKNFWLWHFNPAADEVPTWFSNAFARTRSKLSLVSDPHFQNHRRNYISDLRSGKKVIIVAHSQGNLYATLAARSIRQEFPQYKDSIGVIGFGSAASLGAYSSIYDEYFTNYRDLVIALLRTNFGAGSVAPGNVKMNHLPWPYPNHSYISDYLDGTWDPRFRNVRALLKQKTFALARRLKSPKNECAVEVVTKNAGGVTYRSATLRGELSKGKEVVTWFNRVKDGTPRTCKSNAAGQTGPRINARQIFSKTVTVKPNSTYTYRACGKNKEGIVSESNLMTFETPKIPVTKVRTHDTLPSEVKATEVILRGTITSGDQVRTWFRRSSSRNINCATNNTNLGTGKKGQSFHEVWRNLTPDTTYYYRSCGRGADREDRGGLGYWV